MIITECLVLCIYNQILVINPQDIDGSEMIMKLFLWLHNTFSSYKMNIQFGAVIFEYLYVYWPYLGGTIFFILFLGQKFGFCLE